jgi:hypothetical protein
LICCKELGTNVGTAKHFQLAKQSHVATLAFRGTSWCISANSGPRSDSQHKYGKKIALGTYILPPGERLRLQFILHVRYRANFCDGAFEYSLRGFHSDHTNSSIGSWMDLGDDCCWPVKWCRVVLTEDDHIMELNIGGWLLPALTGL